MIGKSQVKECDPVFSYLNDKSLLGTIEHARRFELALDEREYRLAGWLAKQLGDEERAIAAQWKKAQSNPENFLRTARNDADTEMLRQQLVYAVERLTYRDPILAAEHWDEVRRRFAFSERQKMKAAEHIALWTRA